MSQILEYVSVRSAALTSNPAVVQPIFTALFDRAVGLVARYQGVNEDVLDEHILVLIWKSKQHFDDFGTNVIGGGPHPLQDYIDAPPNILLVALNGTNPEKTLSAPYLLFNVVTPKDGVETSTTTPVVEKLAAKQQSLDVSHGFFHGPKLGTSSGAYLSVSGWDSSEARKSAIVSEELGPILKELQPFIKEQEIKGTTLKMF